jgi:hypothetical protein
MMEERFIFCTYCGDHRYLNTVLRLEGGQGIPCQKCNYEEYKEWKEEYDEEMAKVKYQVLVKETKKVIFDGNLRECLDHVDYLDLEIPASRQKYTIKPVE